VTHGLDVFAAVIDTPVAAGAGGLILVIFGYLFKELRRKDDGVWAIIAEKDRQLKALEKDRDFWRDKVLREEDEAHEAEIERQRRGRDT
jgi:hypothetical protein